MIDPLISIIVPVYNVEAYLRQCLDSIVNQTYTEIEIICVNDGSSDKSKEILDEYASKDNRIKVVNQKNTGLSGARNAGNKLAKGKYIMYVYSDDWIDHDTCKNAVEYAEKEEADVVFWCYKKEYKTSSVEKHFSWGNGCVFEATDVKNKLYRRFCGLLGDELAHPEYANAIETAWGKLYRASIIINNDIRFVDTKLIGTEDCLFNLYVFSNVTKAVYIDKCYNHYRKYNDFSLTKGYKPNLYLQWQSLFDLIEEHITLKQLPEQFRTAIQNRIALSIIGLGLNQCASGEGLISDAKALKRIIRSPRYKKAYAQLEMRYFQLHWRIFFESAKHGLSFLLAILLRAIRCFT